MRAVALQRGTLLVAAGLGSEAVYVILTRRLPWWRYGGSLTSWPQILGRESRAWSACLVGIGLLMAAYLGGWFVVRRGLGQRAVVWGFVLLFAATLFWLLPITSDLFSYLTRAYVLTDMGGNPFLDAPLNWRDPLLLAYPTQYASYPSVYGPAWLMASAPGTLGPHDVAVGVFYLKGLATVSYASCAWFLERILRQVRPGMALEGLYLFAWNPLVLLLAVGDGHNDVVMMAAVLFALWLLLGERWALAFAALAFSVWIKYVSAVFAPLFALYVWRRFEGQPERARWAALTQGGLVGLLVSALVFAPFWTTERMPGIAQRLLQPVNWRGGFGPLPALALMLGLGLFAAAWVFLAWQMMRGSGSYQQLATACFSAVILAFLLGAMRSQPWHLIWPAALAGLSEQRWAWPAVVGLSAVMLVVQVWAEWGAPGLTLLL